MNDIATPATPVVPSTAITGDALVAQAAAIRDEVAKAFIGQDAVLDQVIVALLAGGHVLLEGVPGLGKTLLVRALAQALGCNHARVQFTPDLMPSDISGHAVYDPKTERFQVRRGPVFTNLLLADEINRAPAKTQSALLEAMQEQQVTIEGQSFPLAPPFMTLATQNPLELEGTYPLPEAQLDRFLLKLLIGYPSLVDEKRMVAAVSEGRMASDFDLAQRAARRRRRRHRAPAARHRRGARGCGRHRLRRAHGRRDAQVAGHRARRGPARQHRARAHRARAGGDRRPRLRHARRHARDREAGACAIASRSRRKCRSKASAPDDVLHALLAKVEAPRQ